LKVLKLVFNKSEEIFNYSVNKYKRKYLGKDDILDAISMAVTARRDTDRLISIPENSQFGSKEILMETAYRKWANVNYHA